MREMMQQFLTMPDRGSVDSQASTFVPKHTQSSINELFQCFAAAGG